jgi:hypothetical protein
VVTEYRCGECGNSFTSDAAVKEHRRFAHGTDSGRGRIEQTDRDDGGAAFGMSLRDYFAAQAMEAILNRDGIYNEDVPHDGHGPENVHGWFYIEAAKLAYEMADAMLKARKA